MDRLLLILIFLGLSGSVIFANLSEASQNYHRLLLKKPENAMVFERFLQAWLTTDDRESLEKWLQERAKEGGVADWQILATYYEDAGENAEGLAALDRAVKLDGANLSLRLARAKLRAKGIDFEGALDDLKPVIEDANLQQEALTLQGIYQVRVGQPNLAAETWGKLVKLFPRDEALREDLIEIEVGEGLFEKAIESSLALVGQTKDPYQKALRRIRLAEIYSLADRRDESLATYEKVMAASGEGTWLEREVLSQVEQIFVWQDDVQGLRDYYQKLRENFPRRTSVRKALAKQMARNGEMKEAIALFREVLKITPGDFGNREEFVAFLEVNELWEDASIEIEELIRQKGDDLILWERFVLWQHQLKDEAGLRKGLAKLRELREGDAEGIVALAKLYGQLEMAKEGEEILMEGRNKFPESVRLAEALAEVLAKSERRAEARDLWLSVAKSGERDDVLGAVRSMSRNGLKVEAFEVLLEQVGKSPEEQLLVTSLAQFATTPEQAEKVTPFILRMVERAKTPTALETAVALAAGVVLRSERELEVATNFEKNSELSIPLRCLLAELHLAMGDRMKAREILEGGGDDRLVNFFRVRFEEKEGDLGSAITLLEKIVANPDERKAVHLRRLVDLYQKSGRLVEALERADGWKKMSPGNEQAWLTKARLLTAAGQQERAVIEYRRILGKFGAEEENRARLAAALEDQRDYQGAGKIYRKLYETAEDQRDQLKWVVKWAVVMKQVGKSEEVVEALESRKKSNRKSAGPLLALAEVYGVLGDSDKRRAALLEAVRRKPGGWGILLDLAKESEKEGDFESTIKTLKEAVVLENGGESKRALAEFLLRIGDVEGGLAVFKTIPGEGEDPRQVEKTIEALASAGNWENARGYLAGVLPRHVGDWRLEYLQGLLFLQNDETDKALGVMKGLDRLVQALPGLSPAASTQPSAPILRILQFNQSGSSKVIDLEQVYRQCLVPIGQSQGSSYPMFSYGQGSWSGYRRPGRMIQGTTATSIFSLPKTPDELAKWVFVRKAILLSGRKDEAGRKDFDEMVNDADFDAKVFLLKNLRADQYREFLLKQIEKNPGDLQVAELWLRATPAEDDEYREVTNRAFELLSKEKPLDVLWGFSYYYTKVDPYDEGGFESWSELYHGLSKDEKLQILPTLITQFHLYQDPVYSWNKESAPLVPNPKYIEEWEFLEAEVLGLDRPIQATNYYHQTVEKFLKLGKGAEAVKLINRCAKWAAEGGSMMIGPQYQPSRQSRNEYRAISMPEFSVGHFVHLSSLLDPSRRPRGLNQEEKKRQLSLLENLRAVDEGDLATSSPGDVLGQHVHEVEDPLYRGLILVLLDMKEELEKLLPLMIASKEPQQLRFVASYHVQNGQYRKSYEILLLLSNLDLDRAERRALDGNLAYTANLLSEADLNEVDLNPAREAVIRVQRRLRRSDWPRVMRKLGLDDEADRLERIAQNQTKASQNQFRIGRRKPALQGRELIAKELAMKNPDKAIAEVQRLLRGYGGRQNRFGGWSEILTLFEGAKQISPLMKKLRPQGRGRVRDWFLYGAIALQVKMEKEAKEAFERVMELEPDHHNARLELFLLEPREERDWSIFSKKENPDSAAVLGLSLYEKFSGQRPLSYDLMMDTCRAARIFLEGESELDPRKDIRGWLSNFCQRAEVCNDFGDFRIIPLKGTWDGDKIQWDQKRSQRRVAEFRKLYETMLNHGFHADQGFRGLKSARDVLGLTDEELFQFANHALAKVLEKLDQEGAKFVGDPFTANESNLLSSSAIVHLLEIYEDRKGEVFTEATLKVMSEDRPELFQIYQFALRILNAPPNETGEIYKELISGFSKEERARTIMLGQVNQLLTAFQAEDGVWADLHEKELLEMFAKHQSDLSSVTYWGRWVFAKRGSQGFYQWISKLFENTLGDRERWPLLEKIFPYFRSVRDQQNISRCERQLKALMYDPTLTTLLAAALKKENLEGLLPEMEVAFQKMWGRKRPSIGDNYLDWLKSFGTTATLLDSGDPDVFRLLVFMDFLSKAKVPSDNRKAEFRVKLEEDGEFDPVMKELLKMHWGLPVNLPAFLNQNLDVFVKLEEVAPFRVAVLIGKWLPKLGRASLSEASGAFVAKVTGETRAKLLKSVTEMAEAKGGAEAYLRDAKSYQFFAELIPLAPLEVARAFGELVAQALDERDQKAPRFRDSSSPGRYRQQRLSSMIQLIREPTDRHSALSSWRFINALCHGLFADHVEAILSNQGQLTRLLTEMVRHEKNLVRAKGATPGVNLKLLRPVLEKLTIEERRSMLLFLPMSGELEWRTYRDGSFRDDFKWVDQEFRKDFPACADYWTAVMSRGISDDEYGGEMSGGSANLLRYLKESQFPSSLKIVAITKVMQDSRLRLHLKTSEHWEWIGEAIEKAQFAQAEERNSESLRLLTYLKYIQFETIDPIPPVLVSTLMKFQEKEWKRAMSERTFGTIFESTIVLAANAGDRDSVKRLLESSPKLLESNLPLQRRLFGTSCGDLLPGTLDVKMAEMNIAGLPPVGRGSLEKIRKFVSIFPKDYRFHLERQFLSARDQTGENAPELAYQDRVLMLAKRYLQEGGGPREFVLSDLAFFAKDERTHSVLSEHFLAEEKNRLLGTLDRDSGNEVRMAQLREIIMTAVEIEAVNGNFEPARRQFQSVFGQRGAHRDHLRAVEEAFTTVAYEVLRLSIKRPERASEFISMTDEFFKGVLRLPNSPDSYFTMKADAFSSLQRLLANQPADEKADYRLWKEYQEFRRNHPLTNWLQVTARPKWSSAEAKAMMSFLQNKILTSDGFLREVNRHPVRGGQLFQAYALIKGPELKRLMGELPKETLMEPFIMWKTGLFVSDPDDSFKELANARRAAKDAGFVQMEVEVMIDMVSKLRQSNRDVEARKLASEFDPEVAEKSPRWSSIKTFLNAKP